MKIPRWVPRLVVDAVHLDQLREHGGKHGLRDENALEAALARPQQKHFYEPDSDIADLAAAYAFGLATAHSYNDGNKRIAFVTLMVFLNLNKHDIEVTEEEVVQTLLQLAAGRVSESELATWLRPRIKRIRRTH